MTTTEREFKDVLKERQVPCSLHSSKHDGGREKGREEERDEGDGTDELTLRLVLGLGWVGLKTGRSQISVSRVWCFISLCLTFWVRLEGASEERRRGEEERGKGTRGGFGLLVRD